MEFSILLKELAKLNLPKDKFVIFGSGPMAIRGIRNSEDLDILVKEDLWKELSNKYPLYDTKKPSIKIGNIEIFNNWLPWFKETAKLLEDYDLIQGLRFVKLKYLVQWKTAMGRDKDLKDVVLIKEFIKDNQE